MAHQGYKDVNAHAHEISGSKILPRLLHARAPYFVGINGYVQSDLSTQELNNKGNNLNIFIKGLYYFNSKLTSVKKMYLLKDFSSST